MTSLDYGQLERLLGLADVVVTWTTQDTIRRDAAAAGHLAAARQAYYRARVDAFAAVRPLTPRDSGGCTCGFPCEKIRLDCMYHYAAGLQPDNHGFPWNCPTYYDGCNCGKPGATA